VVWGYLPGIFFAKLSLFPLYLKLFQPSRATRWQIYSGIAAIAIFTWDASSTDVGLVLIRQGNHGLHLYHPQLVRVMRPSGLFNLGSIWPVIYTCSTFQFRLSGVYISRGERRSACVQSSCADFCKYLVSFIPLTRSNAGAAHAYAVS